MLGLFSTLNLGARSLQTQQQAVEVAGQNLANVNNTAYARQRVQIQTSATVDTNVGPQGTGANVVAIQQLRDALVDRQIQNETSVGGYWVAQQSALQYAQASLGEQLDRSATGAEGAAASGGASALHGLSSELSNLFSAFQSVSASPDSTTNRQQLLGQAQTLATRFNQIDQRLSDVAHSLNGSLSSDVDSVNQLLANIDGLNRQIVATEGATGGTANDLRDLRQKYLEDLAKLGNIDTSVETDGTVNISIGGQLLVSGTQDLDTLQTFDAGGGQLLVRTASSGPSGASLALTGGSMSGTIDVRDGALAALRNSVNGLATQLINEVNTLHAAGRSLTGSTGLNFFTGTDAATIRLNAALVNNPELIQASGVSGASGDNQTALALAQLANARISALGNQTFTESYSQTVAELGQALATANSQSSDQKLVQKMLQQQRDSISGVSLDEEMSNLVTFQRAYEASAKLMSIVDQMLATVIGMKQ
jgi:flagellar hook-associated protein 1 FlgK